MIVRKATLADVSSLKPLYLELEKDAVKFQPEHFVIGNRDEAFFEGIIKSQNQDILLAELEGQVVGFAHVMMEPGQIGNAITVAPYVSLPVDSIPGGSILTPERDMEIMEELTMPEWLEKMGYKSLTADGKIKY